MKSKVYKPRKLFTAKDVAKEQMLLLEKKYGILPDEVTEYGYFYNGKEAIETIKCRERKEFGH